MFWRTVCGAYKFVFTNPSLLIWLIWPASVFLIILTLLQFFRAPQSVAVPFLTLAYLLLIAVTIMAGLAFNRAILLNERHWLAVRFHWPHWRFLGASFVIVLVMSLPFNILTPIIFAFFADSVRIGLSPYIIVVVAWGVVVLIKLVLWSAVGRLMLALPAIALGEGAGIFARAWQRSNGNVWRLFLGWALTWIPLQLLPDVVSRLYYLAKYHGSVVAYDNPIPYSALLSAAIHGGTDFLSACLAMAFYAYSYAQLAQPNLAQTLTAARAVRSRTTSAIPGVASTD